MYTLFRRARIHFVRANPPSRLHVAASAWAWLYRADCVDAPSLRRFYADHAGRAPEDFCADGSYP